MSSTSFLSLKNHSLPLFASAPFINTRWLTNIYHLEIFEGAARHSYALQAEVKMRIKSKGGLPQSTFDFLLRLAKAVDSLSDALPRKFLLAQDIGLGTTPPRTGYPTQRSDRTFFFYPFMCAIVLDRCLWALGCSGTVPQNQWIHPYSYRSTEGVVPYHALQDNMRNFLVSYGSCGFIEVDDEDPLVELNANISAATAAHSSNSDVSSAMAHLYFLASGFLALSVERKSEHLEALGDVFRRSNHLPPMLIKKLDQIYGTLGFNDLKQCYIVLSSSILDIFSSEFSLKKKYSTQFCMEELLVATSRPVGQIPGNVLDGERALWNELLNIIGQLTPQGDSGPPVTSTSDQEIALRTLGNPERQELRLLKLVANVFKAQDTPASDLAMCSLPWEHADLLPYNRSSLSGTSHIESTLASSSHTRRPLEEADDESQEEHSTTRPIFYRPTKRLKTSHITANEKSSTVLQLRPAPSVVHSHNRPVRLSDLGDQLQPRSRGQSYSPTPPSFPPPGTLGFANRHNLQDSQEEVFLRSTPVPDDDLVQVSVQEKDSVQEEDDISESLKEEFDELKLLLKERESIAGFKDSQSSNTHAATSQNVKSTRGGNEKGTMGRGRNKGVNTRPSGRGKKPGKVSNKGKVVQPKGKGKIREDLVSEEEESGDYLDSDNEELHVAPALSALEDIIKALSGEGLLENVDWLSARDRKDPAVKALDHHHLLINDDQECETIMASLWAGIAGANGIEFQRQNFNIPWPVGSKESLEQFRSLLELSGHNDASGPYSAGCCLSVLDTEVASWTLEELLQKHRKHDLHIVPQDPLKPMEFNEETCQALGIDVYQPREVHEGRFRTNTSNYDEMRSGNLQELLSAPPECTGRQNINFLSIPLPFISRPPSQCVNRLSLLSHASQQYGNVPFPVESLSWALVATAPAMSDAHIDAGKFCTFIQPISGSKLWLLLDPEGPSPPDKLMDIESKHYRWVGLVLQPGHMLIMRPDRPHIVFTLEDSIVVGGHFYSSSTLDLSLRAGLHEHLFGRYCTNTEHLASEAILHRIIQYFCHLSQPTCHASATKYLPDPTNLAALIAMSLVPQFFEPQQTWDQDGQEIPWTWPRGLEEDRLNGKRSSLCLLGHFPDLQPLVCKFIKEISDKIFPISEREPLMEDKLDTESLSDLTSLDSDLMV